MENLFSTLVGSLPAPTTQDRAHENQATTAPAALNKIPTADLIASWKEKETPELTAELLHRMQPTINSAVTSYAPGMDKQLSVKAANLTLDALRSYNPAYGTEPSTHVFHNLKRLSRLGARASNIIPQSEKLALERRRVQEAIDDFVDRKDREPSTAELVDITGISVKKLDKILDAGSVVSESATLSEDSGRDTLAKSDLTDTDYFEYVYRSVSPVDQKIMEWTSGLHGQKQLSNNDIASKLRISAAAVSQRKNKIQQMLSDIRTLV